MFIGNGGSADRQPYGNGFLKNGGIKATAFNDSVLLTCIAMIMDTNMFLKSPLKCLPIRTMY